MEIVPGIHQVDGINGNAYIIIRDRLVIIDTGITGSGKTILSYIRNTLHRKPEEIGQSSCPEGGCPVPESCRA